MLREKLIQLIMRGYNQPGDAFICCDMKGGSDCNIRMTGMDDAMLYVMCGIVARYCEVMSVDHDTVFGAMRETYSILDNLDKENNDEDDN